MPLPVSWRGRDGSAIIVPSVRRSDRASSAPTSEDMTDSTVKADKDGLIVATPSVAIGQGLSVNGMLHIPGLRPG
jgi:hypothetical protein